jgi:hypothetical protein
MLAQATAAQAMATLPGGFLLVALLITIGRTPPGSDHA